MFCLVFVLLCLSSFSSLSPFIYLFIYFILYSFIYFLLLLHVLFYLLFLYLPGAKSGGNMCTLGLANGICFEIFNHDPQ